MVDADPRGRGRTRHQSEKEIQPQVSRSADYNSRDTGQVEYANKVVPRNGDKKTVVRRNRLDCRAVVRSPPNWGNGVKMKDSSGITLLTSKCDPRPLLETVGSWVNNDGIYWRQNWR